jgi:hypothetical protein
MGGLGSGRWGWYTKKTTVEECRSLDICTLTREGVLKAGNSGTIDWGDSANIGWFVESWGLRLTYTVGGKTDVDYTVPITWTELHNGGRRPWFRCPGVVAGTECGKRVAKLYLPPGGRYFLCRGCYDLTYKSSQESHKYDRLYKKLAENTSMTFEQVKSLLS